TCALPISTGGKGKSCTFLTTPRQSVHSARWHHAPTATALSARAGEVTVLPRVALSKLPTPRIALKQCTSGAAPTPSFQSWRVNVLVNSGTTLGVSLYTLTSVPRWLVSS